MSRVQPAAPAHPTDPQARDHEWLDLIRVGDAGAFESLFRAYAVSLASFAVSYVSSEDTARELIHDLFCWVWEHRFTLETPRSVRAYLFAATRNRARSFLRDRRVETAFLERTGAQRTPSYVTVFPTPDADAEASDLAAALTREVNALPTRCREVFNLVRRQQLSYAEVAGVLQISPKTVEIHMSRALAQLRTRLAPWVRG